MTIANRNGTAGITYPRRGEDEKNHAKNGETFQNSGFSLGYLRDLGVFWFLHVSTNWIMEIVY